MSMSTVTDQTTGGKGGACEQLDYRGAPLPLPGDRCIVSPYRGQPGFFESSYSGLCEWRGNQESLVYNILIYDVGLPEEQRKCHCWNCYFCSKDIRLLFFCLVRLLYCFVCHPFSAIGPFHFHLPFVSLQFCLFER